MIFDNLKNFEKYLDINPGFKTVFNFIKHTDLLNLELGKKVIDESVWYNRQEYLGKEDSTKYESHIKYIDIQLILEGEEYIDYSKDTPIINETNEKDCYFTNSNEGTRLKLSKNDFAIFFPNELHKPGVKVNDKPIKKIVFKVLA